MKSHVPTIVPFLLGIFWGTLNSAMLVNESWADDAVLSIVLSCWFGYVFYRIDQGLGHWLFRPVCWFKGHYFFGTATRKMVDACEPYPVHCQCCALKRIFPTEF